MDSNLFYIIFHLVKNYVRNGRFLIDALAMLPTDLLYIKLGVQNTVVRLPRLLKYGEFGEFFSFT